MNEQASGLTFAGILLILTGLLFWWLDLARQMPLGGQTVDATFFLIGIGAVSTIVGWLWYSAMN